MIKVNHESFKTEKILLNSPDQYPSEIMNIHGGKERNYRILVFLILILISGSIMAQPSIYPVRVNAQMIVGGSVYIGDFANPMATANKLNFTLTLQDPIESERTVYFKVTIIQNGTVIAMNPPGFRGNQVTLERNVPYSINGEDLAMNLNVNNLVGLSGPHAYGVLKEGITDFCLEVIDAFREEPISAKVCATGYLARLQSPILILPIEEQTIFDGQLNNLIFTWQMTDPLAHLPFVRIEYLFELREKSPLLDPQDQFENNTLIFSERLDRFSIFYNELSSPLESSKVYLWRVRALFYDDSGNLLPDYFVNNGFSRVGVFQVLPQVIINPEEQGVHCFCPNGDCDLLMPEMTPAAKNLVVGDSVRFGAFGLAITEINSSGTSGAGDIMIPFINTSVAVNFSNIGVNHKMEVTQGDISVQTSTLLNGIGLDEDDLPDLSQMSIGAEWLSDMNEHVSQLVDHMSLPVSLGKNMASLGFAMPFDIFITDIAFNPFGAATVNLILSIPGPGDQLYNFGASNVKIGRNGFEMAGLKLYLMTDISIPGLSNVPVVINKAVANDPNTGSFISFGCSGMEQFNLQCSYIFPQEQLINTAQPNDPVVATFTLKSNNWGQFTGIGNISPFSVVGAQGWKFNSENIIIDLDQTQNPSEVQLPAAYQADNKWKGFYLDRVSVEMPEEISMTDAGATVFSANDIIIDINGLTCRAEGVNVLDISTGSAGGWAFSIDTLSLNIFQNAFIDAHISGNLGIDVLESEIGYKGLIFKENNNYNFNLNPQGSFTVPFLMLTAEIGGGSVIAVEKDAFSGKYRPYADFNLTVGMQVGEDQFRNNGMGEMVDGIKELTGVSEFNFGLTGLNFNHFRINHPSLPAGKYFGLESVDGGQINIPGIPSISLSEIMLLEQMNDFQGNQLPALGLDISMNIGPAAVGVGVWAKKDSTKTKGIYSFGKYEIRLPDFSGMSFKCACEPPNSSGEGETGSIHCVPPILTGGTATSLMADDKVKVGHFSMVISELSGNNKGKGKMEIPFLNIKMEVDFENIGIRLMPDGTKRVISGTVKTSNNALLDNFDLEISESESPVELAGLEVNESFMSELDNLSSSSGAFFTMPMSLSEKINSICGLTLPEGFDFILLGINFEPDRARLSSMVTFKLPDGTYMKFGLSGLNLRPDGFNLDGIQIFLAEDFTIGE